MMRNQTHPDKDRREGLPKPDFEVPPLACDAHFHVFGAPEKYPYDTDLRYPPPLAPLAEYLTLAEQLCIQRMVFVQPSAYGYDNACMLDAMKAMGRKCRGIVHLKADAPELEVERLHAIGVRGVRINVSPVKPYEAGFADTLIPQILGLAEKIKPFGWHLQFLNPGWLVQELIPTYRKLPVSYVIDHMGLFPAEKGIGQTGFQQLLNLLAGGNCWVKLTGVYRMSKDLPRFKNAAPFAQALIDTAPDRILWGSDFPHLSFHDKVSSLALFNLLKHWAPDDGHRQKILVDNPAALFGFD